MKEETGYDVVAKPTGARSATRSRVGRRRCVTGRPLLRLRSTRRSRLGGKAAARRRRRLTTRDGERCGRRGRCSPTRTTASCSNSWRNGTRRAPAHDAGAHCASCAGCQALSSRGIRNDLAADEDGKGAGKAAGRGVVWYGVVNIVSSPWKWCRDTVAPYALASGQDADMCAALTEAAHEEAPHAAAGVVNNVIRRGVPTAVRPPADAADARRRARGLTPHPLRRKLPADPWLKTGRS